MAWLQLEQLGVQGSLVHSLSRLDRLHKVVVNFGVHGKGNSCDPSMGVGRGTKLGVRDDQFDPNLFKYIESFEPYKPLDICIFF